MSQYFFEVSSDILRYVKADIEPLKIIRELEAIFNERIIPGETLLFFDEIQACPSAVLSLRYFYEKNPELHIIAAGSMLEFALSDLSFPGV